MSDEFLFTERDLSLLSLPLAIAEWPDETIAHVNDAFVGAFYGKRNKPTIVADVLPMIDWEAARQALHAGRVYDCDIAVGPVNREAHYRVVLRTIGQGKRLLVEASDIGRQREAEYMLESYSRLAERNTRALAREKDTALKLFEQFTRNAPVGMYAKDGQGRYIMVNPQMEALFGRAADTIVGNTVRELLPPAEAAVVEQHDRMVLETRKTSAVVEELSGNDAFEWSLVVRFPIETSNDPDMIGGFDIDITAQKRIEQELERSRERLVQAERMTAMGSLLAGVSHELNNPLAIIVGEATLLEEDAAGTALEASAIRIREAADRCARIVRSFLAIARQKPARNESIDLNAMIAEVVRFTDYQMRSSDIAVELDLAPDLASVAGDPDQLQQVFANLFINAQQALQEAPLPRVLRVASFNAGGEVAVRVSDNGPGVEGAIAGRVFEPFFTTKPEGSGTGIGLSYSQGVVAAHEGALVLETGATGGGASFLVTLPCKDGDCAPVDPGGGSACPPVGTRGRALVVDDERDLAAALARLLERLGFSTDTAGDGSEAIALLGSGSYALVLSDIRMPGMDGIALHRWIIAHRPDLVSRIAFVTGDTLSPAASAFLADDSLVHISKPVTRAELAALADRLVPQVAP